MEGRYVTRRQILNEKLLILQQQKQDVSKCLDEVLRMGRAWDVADCERMHPCFEEMCQLIEDTSQLVANACSQITVAACDKKSESVGKAEMKEVMVSIPEMPQGTKESVLKQEHSCELTQLKEDMKKMSEKHNKTATEVDKRISDLDQVVRDLIKVQSDNERYAGAEGKKKETYKADKKRHGDLLCKLMMDVENMQGEFKELTTQHACWQSLENSERFNSLQQQVERQDKKLSVLCDKEITLKELYENLSGKVTSNSDDIFNISSQQKKWCDMLHRLDREMETVQKQLQVTLKKCEQTSNDMATRERKLEEMLKSSASALSLSEATSRKQWIGFAAKLRGEWFMKKNAMTFAKEGDILNFNVIYNSGCFFDPAVGKFTIPRDGVYLICLTMHQYRDGQVLLHVTKQPNRCQSAESSSVYSHKYCILEASTSEDLDKDSLFSCVQLKASDNLYVRVTTVEDNPLLTDSTIFSCFLLS